MTNPRYSVDQEVYIRSSAAIGMLEPVWITGMFYRGQVWVYNFRTGRRAPHSPNLYGNQQSLVTGQLLYLSEDEVVPKCEAFLLAEAHAFAMYTRIKQIRETYCPQNPTEG